MLLFWPEKLPGETLDYRLDWTQRLEGATIVGSVWALCPGSILTLASTGYTNTISTVWIAGGVAGATYVLTNTVTTSNGKIMIEQVYFRCVDSR